MMVFKRKQIVVLSLVLMLVVAGYLQYSYKKGSTSVNNDNSRLGEAVYVDSDYTVSADDKEADNNKDKKEDSKDVKNKDESKDKLNDKDKTKGSDTSDRKTSENLDASKEANDFFAQAKLDKEVSRGKSDETLKAIAQDPASSKDVRNKALEKATRMAENSDREMRIENLIKKNGISDAIAFFADDGSVDIVVKAPNLSSAQTAQIYDVVSRQANLEIDKIRIKNIF
ncbi:MAG TPA: SpoIIIAH-like family protein [Pseudobacteroides sp.]|uniref:SpoIIIAH-like family protein n=1 Tax=Pseudobacteroides sp. TaxID=1968840 RepID=UPI002F91D043